MHEAAIFLSLLFQRREQACKAGTVLMRSALAFHTAPESWDPSCHPSSTAVFLGLQLFTTLWFGLAVNMVCDIRVTVLGCPSPFLMKPHIYLWVVLLLELIRCPTSELAFLLCGPNLLFVALTGHSKNCNLCSSDHCLLSISFSFSSLCTLVHRSQRLPSTWGTA